MRFDFDGKVGGMRSARRANSIMDDRSSTGTSIREGILMNREMNDDDGCFGGLTAFLKLGFAGLPVCLWSLGCAGYLLDQMVEQVSSNVNENMFVQLQISELLTTHLRRLPMSITIPGKCKTNYYIHSQYCEVIENARR